MAEKPQQNKKIGFFFIRLPDGGNAMADQLFKIQQKLEILKPLYIKQINNSLLMVIVFINALIVNK